MTLDDYAGKVESYICRNDGVLGPELTQMFRKGMVEAERPLTLEDADRMISTIDYHLEAIIAKKPYLASRRSI